MKIELRKHHISINYDKISKGEKGKNGGQSIVLVCKT